MEFNKQVSNPLLVGAMELMRAEPNAQHNNTLIVEIIKANLATIRVILSRNCNQVRPQIFHFDSGLNRGFTQTILANSITITPGTYTAGIQNGTLTVHALNEEFAGGTPGSDLNRRLIAMEKKLKTGAAGTTGKAGTAGGKA